MTQIAIKVSQLSKSYPLRTKGVGTLRGTLARLWQDRANVLKKKEDFWALKDISLEVPEGQVLGIIGRNGEYGEKG